MAKVRDGMRARAEITLLGASKRRYILAGPQKHKNVDIILRQAQMLDNAGVDIVPSAEDAYFFKCASSSEMNRC
jgi:hypothetical protein